MVISLHSFSMLVSASHNSFSPSLVSPKSTPAFVAVQFRKYVGASLAHRSSE
jgi:hypothetical protein